MGYKFNPTTGGLDVVSDPGGSDTQIQFNDAGSFGGDVDLTWNKTTNVMTVTGDVNLSDGGNWTTTLQTITPTQNNTISLPNATGTVALVAGSSGQPVYNNAGAYAGLSTATIGATGNISLSLNGASGVSPVALTGTWFAGTTPQVLIQPSTATAGAWSASGTGIGVNAVAAFSGNLLDLQINAARALSVSGNISGGNVVITTNAAGGVEFNNANGVWKSLLIRSEGTVVGSNGYYSWANSSNNPSSTQDLYLLRDAANTLAQRNGTNAQVFRVYNTYTSSTNYELGKLEWSGNVFRIGTEKGSGGGTARALEFQTDGTTRLTINGTNGAVSLSSLLNLSASGVQAQSTGYGLYWANSTTLNNRADGVLTISNYAENDFGRLQLGGTTSSFPALKRNSAVLETKLADDSAYAQHAASVFQAATAHTVNTLPAAPTVGMIARVTDANAPAVGTIVAGSGAAAALVWYNGTNWTVIGV